ncbi:MAG: hypothetical protein HN712_00530 [Gemmatimonadetes bacterium]|jgi:hypothetical protein|nr:hypothetical protein [Gemmatimonadota bacterium]MBT6150298.1 hypothetical protein [Gemmatimonadota bacterium]MBT7858754.1 hypothetical protein [Gemmatimonadota bacterium]
MRRSERDGRSGWWIFAVAFLVLNTSLVTAETNGSWSQGGDIPHPGWAMASCLYDGKIYAFGGGPGYAVGWTRVYDPGTDTWTLKQDMRTPRNSWNALVIDGLIYLPGGWNNAHQLGDKSNGNLAVMEAYNPATDSWIELSPMPEPRWPFQAAVVDGLIYAFGGGQQMAVYDPSLDLWTVLGDMPRPRHSFSAAEVGGLIYFMGGYDGEQVLDAVDVYDPVVNQWSERQPMAAPRWTSSTVVMDGLIYLINGSGSVPLDPAIPLAPFDSLDRHVDVYDPVADTWTRLVDAMEPRMGAMAVPANGLIYYFGGLLFTDGPAWPAAMHVFDPQGRTTAIQLSSWGQIKHQIGPRSGTK